MGSIFLWLTNTLSVLNSIHHICSRICFRQSYVKDSFDLIYNVHVDSCAYESISKAKCVLNVFCYSEISDLYLPGIIYQNIFRFNVTVDLVLHSVNMIQT